MGFGRFCVPTEDLLTHLVVGVGRSAARHLLALVAVAAVACSHPAATPTVVQAPRSEGPLAEWLALAKAADCRQSLGITLDVGAYTSAAEHLSAQCEATGRITLSHGKTVGAQYPNTTYPLEKAAFELLWRLAVRGVESSGCKTRKQAEANHDWEPDPSSRSVLLSVGRDMIICRAQMLPNIVSSLQSERDRLASLYPSPIAMSCCGRQLPCEESDIVTCW
jgi:hypothetical protein